jgi:diguanylate cyclase (GGDEF)-like protein
VNLSLIWENFVAFVVACWRSEALKETRRKDKLTGLLDRRAFEARAAEEWERVKRYGRSLAVVYLDIDGFKSVNDGLSHAAGDKVLAAIGQSMLSCLRVTDVAGRIGGDEFCFLLPEISEEGLHDFILRVSQKIYSIGGYQLPEEFDEGHTFGCSFGVAISSGEEVETFEDLVEIADRRMYKDKQLHHLVLSNWAEAA